MANLIKVNFLKYDMLKSINEDRCAKFANICAVLVLPLIGINAEFDFWKIDDRHKHLYSIFNLIDLSYGAKSNKDSDVTGVITTYTARARLDAAIQDARSFVLNRTQNISANARSRSFEAANRSVPNYAELRNQYVLASKINANNSIHYESARIKLEETQKSWDKYKNHSAKSYTRSDSKSKNDTAKKNYEQFKAEYEKSKAELQVIDEKYQVAKVLFEKKRDSVYTTTYSQYEWMVDNLNRAVNIATHLSSAIVYADIANTTIANSDEVVEATYRAISSAYNAICAINNKKIENNFVLFVQKSLESMKNNENAIANDFNISTFYGNMYVNFEYSLINCDCKYWFDTYDHFFSHNFAFEEEEYDFRRKVPNSIKAQGAHEVAKHMRDILKQGGMGTKEVRIILLGTKGAGKTSLAWRLLKKPFMPRKDKSTDAVDTHRLKLNNEKVHLWDFGGHVIIQAAHKCFMSSECLYVLVIDGRKDQQQDMDNYRKWLSLVQIHTTKNPHVFLVLNRSDENTGIIAQNRLHDEFPSFFPASKTETPYGYSQFHEINIKKDRKGIQNFKKDVENYIKFKLDRKLPAKYYNAKLEIEQIYKKLRNVSLGRDEIATIASKYELEKDIDGLLNYLNTLGVALKYDEISDVILNPSWISRGICSILNHLNRNKMVKIHLEDIPKIFKGREAGLYTPENCHFLHEIMIQYKLAFIPNDECDTMFVPAAFSEDRPNYVPQPDDKEEYFKRRFSFNITLSEDIFPRYTHLNHEHIYRLEDRKVNGGYIAWRCGMVLSMDAAYAKVIKEDRSIEMIAWGEHKSEALHSLYERLKELLSNFGLKWDKDEIGLKNGYCETKVVKNLYTDPRATALTFP